MNLDSAMAMNLRCAWICHEHPSAALARRRFNRSIAKKGESHARPFQAIHEEHRSFGTETKSPVRPATARTRIDCTHTFQKADLFAGQAAGEPVGHVSLDRSSEFARNVS